MPDQIAYDETLRALIAANLARHPRRVLDCTGRKAAAVAIVLVDSEAGSDPVDAFKPDPEVLRSRSLPVDGESGQMTNVAGGAAFLLCRRAGRLRAHAGQWALPGGRVDPGESVLEAALREVGEELGISLGADSVLGTLDDYLTRSGYVITPVVVWGGDQRELHPNPDEVLAVYRVGLAELTRPDSPRFVDIDESPRPVVQVPLSGNLVHAPTGAILVQFRWLALEGRSDPVGDFEQPVFAWT